MRIDCPICKRVVLEAADDFGPRPFCSPRCKMIDLGNWLSEAYRIPAGAHEEGAAEADDQTLS
jgi:uncharacterized protein